MNKQNNISELYNKLTELVDAGDESVVRKFLTEHINEFPEELQKKIFFEFFDEALDNKIETDNAVVQIQKEGLDSLHEVDKAESRLKDMQKAEDLKASMKA